MHFPNVDKLLLINVTSRKRCSISCDADAEVNIGIDSGFHFSEPAKSTN